MERFHRIVSHQQLQVVSFHQKVSHISYIHSYRYIAVNSEYTVGLTFDCYDTEKTLHTYHIAPIIFMNPTYDLVIGLDWIRHMGITYSMNYTPSKTTLQLSSGPYIYYYDILAYTPL